MNVYLIPDQIVEITPPDKFDIIYTINFPSEGSNMIQHEIFGFAQETSLLYMACKYPLNPTTLNKIAFKAGFKLRREAYQHPRFVFTSLSINFRL